MISRFTLILAVVLAFAPVASATDPAPIIRYNSIHHPIVGEHGMVASQHRLASEVGAEILAAGGNAVDAAAAVGFSLAVVLPRAGNLGGGGFMMIHLADNNKTVAVDYRERAPAAAHRDLFLDAEGNVDKAKARFSHAAAGVPGTVAGLLGAQRKYGKLSIEEILAPAIRQAEEGFIVTHDLSDKLSNYKHLKKNPATLKAYYKPNGQAYRAGERLYLKDLAWSLRQILEHGEKGFYEGEVADKIVAEMEKHGGLITHQDLADYHVVERLPVRGSYRGYEIASMPPPSSGGIHIVQMLNMLEGFPLKELGAGSAQSIHLLTESMKRAYADRSKYLGDPDYVEIPQQQLIDKAYAEQLVNDFNLEQTTPSSDILPGAKIPSESPDTTHYSIVDADGNAVSNTYTLNFSFGSGITVAGTGILLNNEMDDFSSKPGVPNAYGLIGAEANKIEAGKRPLSSMTPTLVFKDGKPVLVTGSPGGSRIITTTLQVMVNVLDHGMNVADAVSAPRFHHQWQPDMLFLELGFSPDTLALLKEKQHQLKTVSTMGSAQSIAIHNGVSYGAADPRKPDASAVAAAKVVVENQKPAVEVAQ
ncbi:MAG: gamma-glutamyltransferase [Cellvibrionaceae bacterium]|nr:gamma-glutamyltransferase [Cellvibrionaceae bacterium]